jgi:hypothetical protein
LLLVSASGSQPGLHIRSPREIFQSSDPELCWTSYNRVPACGVRVVGRLPVTLVDTGWFRAFCAALPPLLSDSLCCVGREHVQLQNSAIVLGVPLLGTYHRFTDFLDFVHADFYCVVVHVLPLSLCGWPETMCWAAVVSCQGQFQGVRT